MVDGIELNPAELRSFVKHVNRQSVHVYGLQRYAFNTCDNTDGMDGLMSVLKTPVRDVSDAAGDLLRSIKGGLATTSDTIEIVVARFEADDATSAADINDAFPTPLDVLPADAQQLLPDVRVGASNHGYDDVEWAMPAVPEEADEDIGASIDPGGILGFVEDAWQAIMGESLLAKIVDPIVGNYARLNWLATAYNNLGDSTYQVAWNLRSGTLNVAPHWNGESGREFELHMFRWHQGIGGVGDTFHLLGKLLVEVYDLVSAGVNWALGKINEIIEWASRKLSGAVGWLTTIWDAVTGELYDKIREIVTLVDQITTRIDELRTACEELKTEIELIIDTVTQVITAIAHPGDTIRDAAAQAQDSMFSFEEREDWDPALGAARVLMLPV